MPRTAQKNLALNELRVKSPW